MHLAEGVTAGGQRHGLFVVHCHARERLANVTGRGQRIGISVGAFGVDVNEAHLDCGQRVFQLAITAVAFVAEPFRFRSPVDVILRLPNVFASAGEAEGFEPHGFERAISRKNHQVRPGQLPAIFLFDRPEKSARLVQTCIVGPTVERCKALRAGTRAAASVAHAIGSRAVPRHANEERSIVAVIRRPPVL